MQTLSHQGKKRPITALVLLCSAPLSSYGRGGERGTARPEVLKALLSTTDRVVQQIDSVEYGLTDIQVRCLVMCFCMFVYLTGLGWGWGG